MKHSQTAAASKVKSDESEEQEKERISSLKGAARNKQWANKHDNEQIKKAVREEKIKDSRKAC